MGIICEKLTLEVVAETVRPRGSETQSLWQLYSQSPEGGNSHIQGKLSAHIPVGKSSKWLYLTSKEARRCDLSLGIRVVP